MLYKGMTRRENYRRDSPRINDFAEMFEDLGRRQADFWIEHQEFGDQLIRGAQYAPIPGDHEEALEHGPRFGTFSRGKFNTT